MSDQHEYELLTSKMASLEALLNNACDDIKEIKTEVHSINIKVAKGSAVSYKGIWATGASMIAIISWLATLYLSPLEEKIEFLGGGVVENNKKIGEHQTDYDIHVFGKKSGKR